jgi:hypothetical protein
VVEIWYYIECRNFGNTNKELLVLSERTLN